MFNTLYTIAGGIALAVGALGASDDFDGAQLAQKAFFGPDDELEAVEQEMTTEEVLVAKDVFEWDEIASKAMGMTLTSLDELTDDEKLEIAVINEEIPSQTDENLEEVQQITENSQSTGLSEEEFYSMLEQEFNDAIEALDSKEEEENIADSEPLILEAVQEDLAAVELQPEDDVNAEKALEEVQTNSESKLEDVENVAQVEEDSEESFKEMEPWVVINGLPDILDEDLEVLTNQSTNIEQPVQIETEQTDVDNVDVQEIPVMESIIVDVPEIDESELEEKDLPLFEEAQAEQVEAEDADVEEEQTEEAEEAEQVEAEDADVEKEQTEEAEEAEQVEAEDANVEEEQTEEAEDANVEEEQTEEAEDANVEEEQTEEAENKNMNTEVAEFVEADDALIVEPLEDDAEEVELEDDALLIPSLEIPPAVLTEEQRAKISAEVDAIANQSESFDGWIPRQIPVSGSVEESHPQTKPEDNFIQEFSKKNVKESILENTGIDLND